MAPVRGIRPHLRHFFMPDDNQKLGRLGFDYTSTFYGHDMLRDGDYLLPGGRPHIQAAPDCLVGRLRPDLRFHVKPQLFSPHQH